MHQLLRTLPVGSRVLDLGCAAGSFEFEGNSFSVVRIDLDRGALHSPNSARADAARLPFRDAFFDVIISNHSLEHFENLPASLHEIGRVLKPKGAIYVAVLFQTGYMGGWRGAAVTSILFDPPGSLPRK